MQRMKDEGADYLNPQFTQPSQEDSEILKLAKEAAQVKKVEIVMTRADVTRKITMAELEAHSSEEEPWFAVLGEVYDGTKFLQGHPGGSESITIVAGQDATEDFLAIHSPDAKKQLAAYHIGTLVAADTAVVVDEAPAAPEAVRTLLLIYSCWRVLSDISIRCRFSSPKPSGRRRRWSRSTTSTTTRATTASHSSTQSNNSVSRLVSMSTLVLGVRPRQPMRRVPRPTRSRVRWYSERTHPCRRRTRRVSWTCLSR